MSHNQKVSIIIITYNQKAFLEKSLPIVFSQDYSDYEVVVVDSGSTDGSFELYKKYPIKVVKYIGSVGRNFNYATAFNLAVGNSTGDIYVRLSGDVIPVGDNWLEELITPFQDSGVAGVYSHQVHNKDSDLHHKLLSFFIFSPYREHFAKLAPGLMFWGASAAIRKSCYEEVPFSEKQRRGEDSLWSIEMAKRGYKTFYASKSQVIHNHHKEDSETVVAIAGSLKRFLQMYPSYAVGMLFKNLAKEAIDFKRGYLNAFNENFIVKKNEN